MKKFTLFFAVLALSLSLSAQNRTYTKGPDMPVNFSYNVNSEFVTDTMIPASIMDTACGNHLTIYTATKSGASSNGYVTGSNTWRDPEKAQRFAISGVVVSAQVTNVLAYVYTTTPASAGNTSFKLYNANTGLASLAPNTTVLGTSTAVALNAVSTTSLTLYTFSTPVNVNAKFYASFVVPTSTADTGLIVSTSASLTACTVHSTDSAAWEKWSDGTWHSIMYAWGTTGLPIDLMIMPIVNVTAGIDDDYFFDGIRLDQNQPNPASTATNIQYVLQNGGKVSLEVYDISGKLVLSSDEGYQTAGKHNIFIDANKLNSGTYFYSLKADNHRMSRKMIIE